MKVEKQRPENKLPSGVSWSLWQRRGRVTMAAVLEFDFDVDGDALSTVGAETRDVVCVVRPGAGRHKPALGI